MRAAIVFACTAVALGAGCDWRDFDSIQAHTPVLSVSAPSHFAASNDFGRYLLPLSGPASDATGGTFVVSAASQAALALINVDSKGQVHGQNIDAPALEPAVGGDISFGVTTMAEVPGANQVLLGVPNEGDGIGAVFLLTLAATPTVAMFAAPPAAAPAQFGLGVAAGKLAGADAPELVVASSSDLTVFLDGDATAAVTASADPACPLEVPTGLLEQGPPQNRAVLVAPLMTGGQQIVVGTWSSKGGSVSVFTVDATTGLATCAFSYTRPDFGFGQALATGDFDGDGTLDLLIGSPPSHAFWIKGPLAAASSVTPVMLTAGSGTALGASVAAANVDGLPGDEALVGDPDATLGSTTRAGEVHVVGGAGLDTEQTILHRQSPGASDGFGAEVHALAFCTSGCGTSTAVSQSVPLIGSTTHAFLFFQPKPGSADPRTK